MNKKKQLIETKQKNENELRKSKKILDEEKAKKLLMIKIMKIKIRKKKKLI